MSAAKITCLKLEPAPDPKCGEPCSRSSHGLSLILGGSRLILHGGEHVARTPLDDDQATWACDFVAESQTWQWRRLLPKTKPPARVAHAQAAYDDKIVYIFGGRAGITMGEKAMNDLWKLDASGDAGTEEWTLVEPHESSEKPPEPRSFHKMLCIGSDLYVFGGCGAQGRMADLYKFDLINRTWHNLGASPLLRGRGGANLLPLASGSTLAVVAGFCGEESADGHRFDIAKGSWDKSLLEHLDGMRPRSVCVSGSFPSTGLSVIVGGEVDPSERGHEGAGGFENDVVVLNENSGNYISTIRLDSSTVPEARGWSDAATQDDGNGKGHLFIYGGLSGDDTDPRRLDDLWRLDIKSA